MKQLSRLSAPAMLFFVSILMLYSTALMTSCAAPAKKARPSEAQGAGAAKSPEGSQRTKQTIEQRLDQVFIRLQKIEKVMGLNEAQDVDIVDISEADITENGLPSENSDDVFPPDASGSTSVSKTPSSRESAASGSSSPEAQYNRARSLLLANEFKAAEEEFKSFAATYPDHPLAVNSYYWMGECRYSIKDYQGAITIFKQLVEKYPNGSKVPDSLLKTAYAYLSIKDTYNAREYLKTVVRKFPFSPAGEKAEKKLQSLK